MAASVLAPRVGTAKDLEILGNLRCWLNKQTNATSQALSELLTDVESIRQATLQNRATILFLLLGQGHGCEDFEGMCCMNLSDHSKSIHKSIQILKEEVRKLQVESDEDWLKGLLKNGMYQVGLYLCSKQVY